MADPMPFFDRRVETLPRESLRELQSTKLVGLIERVFGHNRFYTDRMCDAGLTPSDIRSVDDLTRLPLTTKRELSEAAEASPPFGTNVTFPEEAYTRIHQTSGTTGPPLKVLDTEESWKWWGRCWGYVLAGAGVTPRDRLYVAFSFGPFIGFWGAVEGARRVGALMIPGGGADSVERLYHIGDQGATAMCCTPTYALRLAEVARAEDIDLARLPIRTIITAGEPGGNIPDIKRRIETAWGAKCFDHAGASEVGAHSFECELQPGATHAIEPEFIFEVLDVTTHEPLPPGQQGELVITNLGRVGSPAIRYRTGDLVRLCTETCACGRTLARFEGGVLGRADDMVIVRGVNIFPEAVENLIRRVDAVSEYQITVSTPTDLAQLAISIEVVDGADPDDTRMTLTKDVHNVLGLRPVVTVAPPESLPRFEFKARRFHVAN